MRGIVVGISMLALGASVVQAEARFRFRGGGSHSTPLRGSLSSTPGIAVVPGLTFRSDASGATAAKPAGVMTAEALGAGDAGSLKIPTAMPAHAAPAPLKKPDEPWCRSGRVAGSGAGFCLIN